MERETKQKAIEIIKSKDATVSSLAEDLEVPVRWLYFQLDNSPIFEIGDKQSENPNSHEVIMKDLEDRDIEWLLEELREITEVIEGDRALGMSSGSHFRREASLSNAIHEKGYELEPCLTCEKPIAPKLEVEENECPKCGGCFDVPEDLKNSSLIDSKKELLKNRERKEFGWAIPLDPNREEVKNLSRKNKQRKLEQKLKKQDCLYRER